MAELFLTRVWATLASGVNTSATSWTLNSGQGARFGTINPSDLIRAVGITSSGQIEDILITARSTDTLTVTRGGSPQSFLAGDRIEVRINALSMQGLAQRDQIQAGEPTFAVNTGTSNDLIATLAVQTIAALVNGMEVNVELTGANDDVGRLKLFLGATDTDYLPLRKHSPAGLVHIVEGDLPGANCHAKFKHDASAAVWILVNPATTEFSGRGGDYWGSTRPAGYLYGAGQTIGDAASGATARAKADTETLFTLLWNSTANTEFPIQDSSGAPTTRGANAAADFAAHKRMPLPDKRDRVSVGLGNMGGSAANRITTGAGTAGIDTTKLGVTGGSQFTHQHTHTQNAHDHSGGRDGGAAGAGPGWGGSFNGGLSNLVQTGATTATNQDYGTGASQNVQPIIVAPYVIRL